MRKMIPHTIASRILLTALFLGFVWDRLFYGRSLGLSLLVFLLLLLLALGWNGESKGIAPRRRNLWLLAPLLGLALLVALRADPGLQSLNLLAILALLGLLAHFYSGGRPGALGLLDYPLLLAQVGGHTLFQAAPLLPQALSRDTLRRHRPRHLVPLLRGLALALPLLAFFTLLFLSADLVFASFAADLFRLDLFTVLMEGTWRGLLILLVAWMVAGGFAYTLLRARPDKPPVSTRIGADLREQFSLAFPESITVLVLVNTLFAVFVWIQFAYLFGGRAHLVLENFTYAEYARRGFFELVTVALTALALIRGLQWLGHSFSKRQRQLFNLLSSAMIGLVMVMLVSAFQRLQLYEAAFGYTRLRLMVHLFIIWLALLLSWQSITLWSRRQTFALAALWAALAFLFSLNLLNPDALIARQNMDRYLASGKVDAYYLANLSADAVPTLVQTVAETQGETREILCHSLRRHELQLTGKNERWITFNLGRWRARRALAETEWQALCPPLEPRV